MLKTLEMSAIDVYIVRSTHLYKGNLLRPPKQAYVHCATLNMQKYDDLYSANNTCYMWTLVQVTHARENITWTELIRVKESEIDNQKHENDTHDNEAAQKRQCEKLTKIEVQM